VPNLSSRPIQIFISYADEDQDLYIRMIRHLSNLGRQGVIKHWSYQNITAGSEWEREIDAHLNSAQIILLLISVHFMSSDRCYELELPRAMAQSRRGTAIVMPILLSAVDWEGSPFSHLKVLPSNGEPITSSEWDNRDEAFEEVCQEIREAIEELRSKSEPQIEQPEVKSETQKLLEQVALVNQTPPQPRSHLKGIAAIASGVIAIGALYQLTKTPDSQPSSFSPKVGQFYRIKPDASVEIEVRGFIFEKPSAGEQLSVKNAKAVMSKQLIQANEVVKVLGMDQVSLQIQRCLTGSVAQIERPALLPKVDILEADSIKSDENKYCRDR
jgi:hypothetical protein